MIANRLNIRRKLRPSQISTSIDRSPKSPWMTISLASATAVVSALYLYFLMQDQFAEPFRSDVTRYLYLAEHMQHPLDTSDREYLWIWIVKLFSIITSNDQTAIRSMGITLYSLATTLLAIYSFRVTKSLLFACLAVGFFLSNQFTALVFYSGLRDSIFVIVNLLALLSLTTNLTTNRTRHQVFIVSTWIFLVFTTNLSMVVPSVILLVLFIRHSGIELKAAIKIVSTIFVGALIPYLVYCHSRFGDPLYASNIHAKWWRNYEFIYVKKTGCTGCPSVAEYAANTYSGESLSTFDYLFQYHSLQDLLLYSLKGLANLFFNPSSSYFYYIVGSKLEFVTLFYFLGLGCILFSKFRWYFLIPILYINFLAFLLHLQPDPRMFIFLTPYTAIASALGIFIIVQLGTLSNEILSKKMKSRQSN